MQRKQDFLPPNRGESVVESLPALRQMANWSHTGWSVSFQGLTWRPNLIEGFCCVLSIDGEHLVPLTVVVRTLERREPLERPTPVLPYTLHFGLHGVPS